MPEKKTSEQGFIGKFQDAMRLSFNKASQEFYSAKSSDQHMELSEIKVQSKFRFVKKPLGMISNNGIEVAEKKEKA